MRTSAAVGRGLSSLRAFARAEPMERCDACGVVIGAAHDHLFVHAGQPLVCACASCAQAPGARVVPRRVVALDDLALSDAAWASIGMPISLAFFVVRDPSPPLASLRVSAMYPSPAGMVESEVSAALWSELVAATPALATMLPEVEALLVSRLGDRRRQLLVPLDAYFELTARLRASWKGLFGGERAFAAIEGLLASLQARALEEPCPR